MAASATDSGNKDREIRKQLIQTGHVDCLMSVLITFYKVSLPCSLGSLIREERRIKG